jgi:hypothetical protein
MQAEDIWAWREGANPYRESAFLVLDVGVDVHGRLALKRRIEQRMRRVINAPARYRLYGRTLSEEELRRAANAVLDPSRRVYEELRAHRPRVDISALRRVVARVDEPRDLGIELPDVRLERQRLAALVPDVPERRFDPVFDWQEPAHG